MMTHSPHATEVDATTLSLFFSEIPGVLLCDRSVLHVVRTT